MYMYSIYACILFSWRVWFWLWLRPWLLRRYSFAQELDDVYYVYKCKLLLETNLKLNNASMFCVHSAMGKVLEKANRRDFSFQRSVKP